MHETLSVHIILAAKVWRSFRQPIPRLITRGNYRSIIEEMDYHFRLYNSPVLLAFGNPLLDVCVQTPENVNICQEFGISRDGESEVTSAVAKQLQQRISSFPNTTCCGGSALNTTRVLQWLLGRNNKVSFSGTLGKDENAKLIREMTQKDGIITKFAEHASLPTGVTTVLIHGHYRSLVAHIGAAQVYQVEYLSQDLLRDIWTTQIVLLEGYFCLHNLPVCQKIVQECLKYGTCIVYTLSSDYLYQNSSNELLDLIKCSNILIGNKREFKALAKVIQRKISDDSEEWIHSIFNWCTKEDTFARLKLKHLRHKGKIVICTDGKNSVVCGEQMSGAITSIPVPKVEKVVDGTGTGDSFASGVLLGILLQKDIITCCQFGMYASGEILQQVGCAIPEHLPQTLDHNSKIGALVG